jgi:hypothetical protein
MNIEATSENNNEIQHENVEGTTPNKEELEILKSKKASKRKFYFLFSKRKGIHLKK